MPPSVGRFTARLASLSHTELVVLVLDAPLFERDLIAVHVRPSSPPSQAPLGHAARKARTEAVLAADAAHTETGSCSGAARRRGC